MKNSRIENDFQIRDTLIPFKLFLLYFLSWLELVITVNAITYRLDSPEIHRSQYQWLRVLFLFPRKYILAWDQRES